MFIRPRMNITERDLQLKRETPVVEDPTADPSSSQRSLTTPLAARMTKELKQGHPDARPPAFENRKGWCILNCGSSILKGWAASPHPFRPRHLPTPEFRIYLSGFFRRTSDECSSNYSG